jgi:ketosteroid isomerase-like protein
MIVISNRVVTTGRHVSCRARERGHVEAKTVVENYYKRYNARNIAQVLDLFSEDIVYEDLIYQEPFVGIDEVAAYFSKIEQLVPGDIQFVVDDITAGDPSKVGVMWHVEIQSDSDGMVELPFSRGASFYEVEDGKIRFARDLVEPALKPGASALGGISAIAPVIRKLGKKANPKNLSSSDGKNLLGAGAMYGFAATYILVVLLSNAPPGNPAYMTDPEDLQRILHESYNFFYVNMVLGNTGVSPVPNIPEHPVDEGIFNFISAWSLTFLPLMVSDPKGKSIEFKSKLGLWIGIMFLTNVFAPWYFARRLVPDVFLDDPVPKAAPESLGIGRPGSNAIAITSGIVGAVSIGWILAGRPEFSLSNRWDFFVGEFTTNRVFWAFCLDAVLYGVWQNWLLKDLDAPIWMRRLPLFGTVAFLLSKSMTRTEDNDM